MEHKNVVGSMLEELLNSGDISKKRVEEHLSQIDNPFDKLKYINGVRTYYELGLSQQVIKTEKDLVTLLLDEQNKAINSARNKSERDDLTGLYNRGMIEDKANERVPKEKYAVLMLDIDDFKALDDFYGHIVGDFIIKNVAKVLQENLRESFVGRYGGEEFYVELNQTDKEGGRITAERVREKVKDNVTNYVIEDLKRNNLEIPEYLSEEEITVSVGVADEKQGCQPLEGRINADNALYESKLRGKNKVHVFDPNKKESGYYQHVRVLYDTLKKGNLTQSDAIGMANYFLKKS